MTAKNLVFKQRAINLDYLVCRAANDLLKHEIVHRFFSAVSRLGDGVLWYVAILCLPLVVPENGALLAMVFSCWGMLNVYIYKRIKKAFVRPRPFMAYPKIVKGARVLDEYSFPSGHTLHAVAFAFMFTALNPVLAPLLVPFSILTGMSRVILGVHYPSDVIFGATLGIINGSLAVLMLGWFSLI